MSPLQYTPPQLSSQFRIFPNDAFQAAQVTLCWMLWPQIGKVMQGSGCGPISGIQPREAAIKVASHNHLYPWNSSTEEAVKKFDVESFNNIYSYILIPVKKLRGLSPRENYTDRVTAAYQPGSAGNRTQDLWICSQELWSLDSQRQSISVKIR
jgi:hypothetical protein